MSAKSKMTFSTIDQFDDYFRIGQNPLKAKRKNIKGAGAKIAREVTQEVLREMEIEQRARNRGGLCGGME